MHYYLCLRARGKAWRARVLWELSCVCTHSSLIDSPIYLCGKVLERWFKPYISCIGSFGCFPECLCIIGLSTMFAAAYEARHCSPIQRFFYHPNPLMSHKATRGELMLTMIQLRTPPPPNWFHNGLGWVRHFVWHGCHSSINSDGSGSFTGSCP